MDRLKRIGRLFADVVELYIPIVVFLLMFVVFLINIFTRYVLKNPQNWTLEFSVNSFVIIGLVGACAAYRKEDHVVFDLFYNHASLKAKTIMRILSYALVILFFLAALPGTFYYLTHHRAISSILRIPYNYIFASFPVLLVSVIIRSAYRMVLDIRSLMNGTYLQTYNTEKEDELI
ncbi:MAG: TRAP transporter small permease [Spirochaetales bacterium]